jgi:uncharacterized UPF0160 family protein
MGLFSKKYTVGVHNGSFHADDAFAVATLSILLQGDIQIIRTRNSEELSRCDYVVDVGSIYKPTDKRFDHHQKGGAGERENGVPYAAFGLVWKEYGERICGDVRVAQKIDHDLVQFVDVMDNGVGKSVPVIADVYSFDVCSVIALMNPSGGEERVVNEYFNRAVDFAKNTIEQCVWSFRMLFVGESLIDDAYIKSEDKRFIVLEEDVEWREIVPKYKDVLFVVEGTSHADQWKVRAVRDTVHSFLNRKDLPIGWAGKQNTELVEESGVPDALFCHNKRFIATAGSREGAIALAKKALEA